MFGCCEGLCPHPSCFLAVLRGFRQGVVYGAKIRFPHALVMTLLFKRGPLMKMMRSVLKATYTHSKNLGCYVALFKFVQCLMRYMTGSEGPLNTLVGGAVGGMVMFGDSSNPINSQINMYVFSRIFFGFCRTVVNKGWVSSSPYWYPAFASTTWACVMYLFYHEQGTLQNSLIGSMTYLYADSDTFAGGMPSGPVEAFKAVVM